jgi:hypothetical protein
MPAMSVGTKLGSGGSKGRVGGALNATPTAVAGEPRDACGRMVQTGTSSNTDCSAVTGSAASGINDCNYHLAHKLNGLFVSFLVTLMQYCCC